MDFLCSKEFYDWNIQAIVGVQGLTEDIAKSVVEVGYALPEGKSIQDIVGVQGWTEDIARAVLGGIENALK